MLSLPQEVIGDGNDRRDQCDQRGLQAISSTNWIQVVAEPESRAVLVLAQLAVGRRAPHSLASSA